MPEFVSDIFGAVNEKKKKQQLQQQPATAEATVFISCTKGCNDRTLLEEERVQSAPLGAIKRWEEQTL